MDMRLRYPQSSVIHSRSSSVVYSLTELEVRALVELLRTSSRKSAVLKTFWLFLPRSLKVSSDARGFITKNLGASEPYARHSSRNMEELSLGGGLNS